MEQEIHRPNCVRIIQYYTKQPGLGKLTLCNNNLKTRGNAFTKTIFIFKDGDNDNKVLEQVLIPIK